ncbi:MAG: hypothetical protein Q3972_03185 [Corynebacterium sp.]|nr:hypothetical protein [Corynebacterium sp.]
MRAPIFSARIVNSPKVVWGIIIFFHVFPLIYTAIRTTITGVPDGTLEYYNGAIDGTNTLNEYPAPNVWIIYLLNFLSFGHMIVLYPIVVVAFVMGFSHFIYTKFDFPIFQFWGLASATMASTTVFRLDIYPGFAVFFAFYLMYLRRDFWAGILLSVATWLKLWPAFLAAAMATHIRERALWLRAAGFVVGVVLFGVLTAIFHGPERIISPLTYQTDRGLQIESIFATPLFVAFMFVKNWTVSFAPSKSYEIFGPGVEVLAAAADYAQYLMILFLAALALWIIFFKKIRPIDGIRLAVMAVCMVIVANKVFSPQYLLWLIPLVVLLVAVDTEIDWRRPAQLMFWIGLLTTLVFPVLYNQIKDYHNPLAMLVMIVRNILVVYLTYIAGRNFFIGLRKH